MNLLSDIITYVRRYIKSNVPGVISDALIVDYINRFVINDVQARLELFDFKTKYQFQTRPGFDRYNMPLYDVQTTVNGQTVNFYPVYQGFMEPVYAKGVRIGFYTERSTFRNAYPDYVSESVKVATGDGSATSFSFTVPQASPTSSVNPPWNGFLRGHVDISGIIATSTNIDPLIVSNATAQTNIPLVPNTSYYPAIYITSVDNNNNAITVSDSGFFLEDNVNLGMLIRQGKPPFSSVPTGTYSTTSNVFNYQTGQCYVNLPTAPASGANINVQFRYLQAGLPTAVMFNNNILEFRTVPDRQYQVELDAYLTPAAYFTTADPVTFGYMAEYIALGSARKILADTGDLEQLQMYEPFFREQELLVLRRSDRQRSATRVPTIYSHGSSSPYIHYYGGGPV